MAWHPAGQEQPPNHYRLLGIGLFESDAEVISNAADRQMFHVRNFQSGAFAEIAQFILNELAAARVCLLDPPRKAEYDRWLQQMLPVQHGAGAASDGDGHAAGAVPQYAAAAAGAPSADWSLVGTDCACNGPHAASRPAPWANPVAGGGHGRHRRSAAHRGTAPQARRPAGGDFFAAVRSHHPPWARHGHHRRRIRCRPWPLGSPGWSVVRRRSRLPGGFYVCQSEPPSDPAGADPLFGPGTTSSKYGPVPAAGHTDTDEPACREHAAEHPVQQAAVHSAAATAAGPQGLAAILR